MPTTSIPSSPQRRCHPRGRSGVRWGGQGWRVVVDANGVVDVAELGHAEVGERGVVEEGEQVGDGEDDGGELVVANHTEMAVHMGEGRQRNVLKVVVVEDDEVACGVRHVVVDRAARGRVLHAAVRSDEVAAVEIPEASLARRIVQAAVAVLLWEMRKERSEKATDQGGGGVGGRGLRGGLLQVGMHGVTTPDKHEMWWW